MTWIAVICDSYQSYNAWRCSMTPPRGTETLCVSDQDRAYLIVKEYKPELFTVLHPLPRDYEAILEILLEEKPKCVWCKGYHSQGEFCRHNPENKGM